MILDADRLASFSDRETLAGLNVDSIVFGAPLPAANDCVRIKRIEFQAAANSSGALGSNDGCPGTKERVENQSPSAGAILNRISDERDWLRRRVEGKQISVGT